MFGLCVVTTISLVGMVWYNSFEKNLFVLLNPEESKDQKFLAETQAIPSLLGNISETGKNLKATFYDLFNLTNNGEKENVESNKKTDPDKVYMLPISGKK